jgi:type IV pilus assembly protein PilY1
MKTSTRMLALIVLVLGLAVAPATYAQTLLSEDFTGATSSTTSTTSGTTTTTTGNWLFFNGACLTAGTSTSLVPPATSIPACTTVLNSYYVNKADHDQYLVGGAKGYLGGLLSAGAPSSPANQQPDPVGSGALRFTNGSPFGNQERGAIVSTNAYSTSAGIQVTFRTVTYGGSGADGISFYLMDGCVPVAGATVPAGCTPTAIYPTGSPTVPAIGATGGSLAYTCTNETGNGPASGNTFDGLTGAYLGLGIDEYGNFLNQGDNTASGWGFQAGRIGLRGAGSISWPALNNAYGTNPGNPAKPFYPAWLGGSCATGTFDGATGTCGICPAVGPTTSTVGDTTTTATTTTAYANGICTNTKTSTARSDSGCTSSGYALKSLAGNAICVKTSTCASYLGSTDATYPNGVCTYTPKTTSPTLTCYSGQGSPDTTPGLNVCGTAPTFNMNFTNSGSTVSITTSTNPPGSTPPYTPNTSAIQTAVQNACSSGNLQNYLTSSPTAAGSATLSNAYNTAGIMDYPAIAGAYAVLPSSTSPLYIGGATTRGAAKPIYYNLKITSDGYLSLSYAYDGGSYQSVLTNQNITASNGAVPNYVRFGFAGSTGGSTNVHEILCFKSAPAVTSASSAGVNEKQSAKVETGTFAYFAYYDTNNWVGRVTANSLSSDPTSGIVSIAATPSWDASCVLTGVVSGQTCGSTAAGPSLPLPASRVILTNTNVGLNGTGTSFKLANLTAAQVTALGVEPPPPAIPSNSNTAGYWVDYMRGGRSNEITSGFTCSGGSVDCFRARTSLLGDIVDSSPTWVGPPQSPYTATWKDKLNPAATAWENSGTQNYLGFVTTEQTRPNVVYVGSNDGMMHGFRSGAFDNTGNFSTTTTPNDGQEVIAYMPGSSLLSASTGGGCTSMTTTGSNVQNIHGVTPDLPGPPDQPACAVAALDFSSPQYGHNFFVDATPGTGDLFYNNTWHTWLVGGMGAGGETIFALDVTNPTPANFTEGNAAALVIGEWTPSNITCVSNTTCGTSLGNTYGTPIIRRLHDGRWAAIFGNGYGSSTGDAGIFVMTVDHSGNMLFYYLSTGTAGTNNGIAYVTSADLDGDHVTDYVYAGDLNGNLWRFDLTSSNETTWAASVPSGGTAPKPLFTAPGGAAQPITTAVTVSSGATAAGANTIMIAFGTGQRTQFNNAAAVQFQPATQSLYGVWDWNMTAWNANSATQYASLSATASGLATPYTLGVTNLQVQNFQINTSDNITRDIPSPTTICWAGSGCGSPKFGWYLPLPGTLEQIVYNPQLLEGIFTVNSIVPANNTVLSCTTNTDAGFTYAISVLTGTAPSNFFVSYHDTAAAGVQTNAVGTSFPVTSSTGSQWLVSQTVSNQPLLTQINPGSNAKGRRLTWVQLR